METMNPAGNTSGKSCGTDLRQCENQQGLLADLEPSGASPPRAAAVAHQRLQHSPSCLQNINAAIQATGPAQGHSPGDGSPGPVRSPGQIGAPSFNWALEAPSHGESGNWLDLVVNRLLSDDCEAYDPEDPNVRALMADYEATILGTDLNTDAAPPAGPGQEHPPVGESSSSGSSTGQLDATLPGGTLGVSFGGEHAQGPTAPLVDPDHVREKMPVRGNCMPATGEQRQAILRIFETHPGKNNRSIADEFGISMSTIQRLRKKFEKTGNLNPGDYANRLSEEQRQAILQIFETDPKRSSQSLVDEFGVGHSTIYELRKKYGKTGNLKPMESGIRLTKEQRQAILQIFKTNPERSNQSLVDEFGVAFSTIHLLRKKFEKTGNLNPGDHAKRLSDEQRQAILQIFKTNPERSNQSIADEFDVNLKTIQTSRQRFSKTGNLNPGDHTNRLSDEQRRAILHIFETAPERTSQSLGDEFGVANATIQLLRKRFSRTGNIKPGASGKHLTGDQRRAILHIFETDPNRSTRSIADEFDVSYFTIVLLRRQFDKTGNLKPRERGKRLTVDQRQAILHIFETDPNKNNQSIADEFNVNMKTIQRFRKMFSKTGHINPSATAGR